MVVVNHGGETSQGWGASGFAIVGIVVCFTVGGFIVVRVFLSLDTWCEMDLKDILVLEPFCDKQELKYKLRFNCGCCEPRG